MHRWVPIAGRPEVARAFAQSGASAVVWRRGAEGVEVLLLHRAVHGAAYDGDWAWSPPGGALRLGETHLECAARELLEETGLDLPVARLRGVANGFAAHVAELTHDEDIVLSDEHDRFEWVPIADACERCRPAVVAETLRAAERHIGGVRR
jgi:8-oxo-dGTP pyrophosphatase MutT (NUDIX family)